MLPLANVLHLINQYLIFQSEGYFPFGHKEWSPIGMLGKLVVRDDGTCQINGYCKPNQDGIATQSENWY